MSFFRRLFSRKSNAQPASCEHGNTSETSARVDRSDPKSTGNSRPWSDIGDTKTSHNDAASLEQIDVGYDPLMDTSPLDKPPKVTILPVRIEQENPKPILKTDCKSGGIGDIQSPSEQTIRTETTAHMTHFSSEGDRTLSSDGYSSMIHDDTEDDDDNSLRKWTRKTGTMDDDDSDDSLLMLIGGVIVERDRADKKSHTVSVANADAKEVTKDWYQSKVDFTKKRIKHSTNISNIEDVSCFKNPQHHRHPVESQQNATDTRNLELDHKNIEADVSAKEQCVVNVYDANQNFPPVTNNFASSEEYKTERGVSVQIPEVRPRSIRSKQEEPKSEPSMDTIETGHSTSVSHEKNFNHNTITAPTAQQCQHSNQDEVISSTCSSNTTPLATAGDGDNSPDSSEEDIDDGTVNDARPYLFGASGEWDVPTQARIGNTVDYVGVQYGFETAPNPTVAVDLKSWSVYSEARKACDEYENVFLPDQIVDNNVPQLGHIPKMHGSYCDQTGLTSGVALCDLPADSTECNSIGFNDDTISSDEVIDDIFLSQTAPPEVTNISLETGLTGSPSSPEIPHIQDCRTQRVQIHKPSTQNKVRVSRKDKESTSKANIVVPKDRKAVHKIFSRDDMSGTAHRDVDKRKALLHRKQIVEEKLAELQSRPLVPSKRGDAVSNNRNNRSRSRTRRVETRAKGTKSEGDFARNTKTTISDPTSNISVSTSKTNIVVPKDRKAVHEISSRNGMSGTAHRDDDKRKALLHRKQIVEEKLAELKRTKSESDFATNTKTTISENSAQVKTSQNSIEDEICYKLKTHLSLSDSSNSAVKVDESEQHQASAQSRSTEDTIKTANKKRDIKRSEKRKNPQPKGRKHSSSDVGQSTQPQDMTARKQERRRKSAQRENVPLERNSTTSKKIFLEVEFPGRLTVQHFLRAVKQHIKQNLDFNVESHQMTEEGTTFIVSVSSKRKANQIITELRRGSMELNMNARIVPEPASVDKVKRMVDETRDFVESRARIPIRQHQEKMEDLLAEMNTLTQARNVQLHHCGSVFDQVEACKSKWRELDAQLQEFNSYTERINAELDTLLQSEKTVDEARSLVSEIKRKLGLELNYKLKVALPMYAKKRVIIDHVSCNQVSVILGETGSGKSTQLTQFLDQSGFSKNGMIVCTQPRKVAAISLAKRVAQEMGSEVGKLVGWRTGTRNKIGPDTKIVYMTDHTLLNECIADPSLSKYSCIIVDEAHERSIFTDLLLGMIKKILPSRPELRVIVTSATIDPKVFIDFFHCSDALKVSGRAFPVNVFYDKDLTDDNYLSNAVQKAIDLHTSKPPGDILVFLTTPIETEKASEMFCKRYPQHNVVCLQIHGQQQPADQDKVFQETPNMERKVVFATNCAETSITIPGVKFVIDAGLAKEKKFDAKKSMSILEVGRISKSSADQRKGRAGRTAPGDCYRLYKEEDYEAMESVSTPEILRAHLGQSLLKLMLLGIPDATDFDFVQSPPRDALLAAKSTLEDLGAIDSSGLTDLGRKLAKLSIEPRLGRLVLDCIEHNIGFEGVIVAALGMIGYNVFFRGKTDKEKEDSDKRKIKMCHDRGDIFTYLKVFQDWHDVSEKTKNKWCMDNSINAKSMRMTRENITELLKLLDKELGIKIHYEFNDMSDVEEHLPHILLFCYKNNLAYYSGHPSVGYMPVADMNTMYPVHPGSALRCLRREPKWIIYEQILHTSQQFALNVTCFDIQEVDRHIDEEIIEAKCVFPVPTETMGPTVVRQFVWKKYGNPKRAEEAMHHVLIQTGLTGHIGLDIGKGNCTIYTQKRNHPALSNHINDVIRPMNERLRRACEEYPMVEGERVRCLLGAGGKLLSILMPEHSRTLTLMSIPLDYTVENVEDFLSMFGTVESVIEFKKSKTPRKGPTNWGKVIFSDHKSAAVALKSLADGEDDFTVKSDVQKGQGEYTEFRVYWCRRELAGYGFIAFDDAEQAAIELAHNHHVTVRGQSVRILPGKKTADQLFMTRIPKDTTKQELTAVLTSKMDGITDVILVREKAKPTSNSDLEMYKRRVNAHIQDTTGRRVDLNIDFRKPRDFDFTLNGTVMSEDEGLVDVLNRHSPLMIENHQVHFEMQLTRIYYIDREIHAVVHLRLQNTVDFVNRRYAENIFISENPLNNGGIRLILKSSNRVFFSETVLLLNQVTDGARLELLSTQQKRFASSMKGKHALDRIMRKTKVFVRVDRWRSIITVYGESTGIDDAITSMKDMFKELDKIKVQEIELAGEGRPFGLMRGLFLKYGIGMEKFVKECELDDIEVAVRQHVLSVFGTVDSIKKAREAVDAIADSLGDVDVPEELTEEDCPVCFCEVDEDFYRAELCGHRYCRSCIDGLFHHGIRSKELPLVCARDSCGEAFVLQDIHNLIGQQREVLQPLVSAATEHLVTTNNKDYQFCPTPDCPVVYRVTRHKHKFICPNRQCRTAICTACKVKYHEGFSCDMYRGMKDDDDYGLKAWMKQSPQNRSMCPNCGYWIQKEGGCMHVTCRCGAHICWRCKETFPSANDTYNHLGHCGGIFL